MVEHHLETLLKLPDLLPFEQLPIGATNYLNEKLNIYKGLTADKKAELYWRNTLPNVKLGNRPQHIDCEFSVVVPVFNEKTERIIKQIESLVNQNELRDEEYEIIYLVNSGPINDSVESINILKTNSELIQEITNKNLKNVHIFDKSTAGNEIIGCNVGKARNLAVAIASYRFYKNNKNGFLIHTDADTYFEDRNYFIKLKEIIKENKNVIGISGALSWKFDPDDKSEKSITLYKKTKKIVLIKKWEALSGFLFQKKHLVNGIYKKLFLGGHMISRSFESAIIGGIFWGSGSEDIIFGAELTCYASLNNLKIIEATTSLFLMTSFRESTRTNASIGRLFDEIDLEKVLFESNPFAAESFNDFLNEIIILAKKEKFDLTDFKDFLFNKARPKIIDEETIAELFDVLQYYASIADFGELELLAKILYEKWYPKVEVSEENYSILEEFVSKYSEGQELISYINSMTKYI